MGTALTSSNGLSNGIAVVSGDLNGDGKADLVVSNYGNAKVLVFLGNAYHQNNLRLLTPEKFDVPVKKIYATRKGVSEPDLTVLSGRLSKFHSSVGLSKPPHYFAEKCADLFDTYRMSLRG